MFFSVCRVYCALIAAALFIYFSMDSKSAKLVAIAALLISVAYFSAAAVEAATKISLHPQSSVGAAITGWVKLIRACIGLGFFVHLRRRQYFQRPQYNVLLLQRHIQPVLLRNL